MACVLLLRGSLAIVTSAWTWSTGFAFPNRYQDSKLGFIDLTRKGKKKLFFSITILHFYMYIGCNMFLHWCPCRPFSQ